MRTPRHRPRLLLVGVLATLLLGCGVSTQTEPVPLPVQPSPSASPAPTESNASSVTVYFVRAGRLAAVDLPAPDDSVETALRLLVEGPNASEAAVGFETALVPQRIEVGPDRRLPLTVDVSPEFTSIAGDDQLLAAAQLVWTATSNAPDAPVRIRVEGETIELPTDEGLSRLPVGRVNYRTVAPGEDEATSGPQSAEPTSEPS